MRVFLRAPSPVSGWRYRMWLEGGSVRLTKQSLWEILPPGAGKHLWLGATTALTDFVEGKEESARPHKCECTLLKAAESCSPVSVQQKGHCSSGSHFAHHMILNIFAASCLISVSCGWMQSHCWLNFKWQAWVVPHCQECEDCSATLSSCLKKEVCKTTRQQQFGHSLSLVCDSLLHECAGTQ